MQWTAKRSIVWIVVAAVGAAVAIVVVGVTRSPTSRASFDATPTKSLPVTAERLEAADSDSSNWLTHGRTYSEQRFSPLDRITRANVEDLKLAWALDLAQGERGQESTPLVVDGVLYLTSSWSRVVALDAKTGALLWRYDPKVPGDWAINACCDVVNRGAAFWDGNVYVATIDGRLVALNAATGSLVWETLVIDRAERATITGAPRIINGRVFIGSAGGELGVRGRYTAVDAHTGAVLWRFFTVPGDPSQPFENLHLPEASKSWTGQWWSRGGGGTVWDAMSYDPVLDIFYVGTGNGSPWPQSVRSPQGGDNLYVSSIVAMRGQTGEYLWHYQTTPGDEWGFDAASQMILADLLIDGQLRQVLMQASANGFFYVLDRKTGQLISATAFVPTTWASGIDSSTGRPIEDPGARYSRSGKPFFVRPSPQGAHSWHPMSFNPATGLVYIPAQINSAFLSVDKNMAISRYRLATGAVLSHPKDSTPDSSQLLAWDPVRRHAPWVIERKTPVSSGVLSTAGSLVLQGSTNGTLEAFDAADGTRLWQTDTGAPVLAAPISYAVGGTQYVAVVVGGGGAVLMAGTARVKENIPKSSVARLLVYSLSGTQALPPATPQVSNRSDVGISFDGKKADRGSALYKDFCARCHGEQVINTGPLRSLQISARLSDPKQWQLVVFAGLLGSSGMPGFMAELKPADVEDIRAYVAKQTQASAASN